MSQQGYPPGWDEERVKRVLAHYEQQSEEEAVAEDEAAFEKNGEAMKWRWPYELVPAIREFDRQSPELELIVTSPHARVRKSFQD